MKSYKLTSGYYVHNKRYVKVIDPDTEDIKAGVEKNKAYLVGGIKDQGGSCSILVNHIWHRISPNNLLWVDTSEEDSGFYINISDSDNKTIKSYQSPPGYDNIQGFVEDLIDFIANSKIGEQKYYELCVLLDLYKQGKE